MVRPEAWEKIKNRQEKSQAVPKWEARKFLTVFVLVWFSPDVSGLRYYARSRGALGQNFTDATDLGAHGLELLFDALVSAVDMIDAVDNGFAVSHQRGDDQRGGSAKIGALHGGGTERRFPPNDGAMALHFDVGAHTHKLVRVHEAVFKDVFRDDGS